MDAENDNELPMGPPRASENAGRFPSAEEALESCATAEKSPHLFALLEGPDSGAIRDELLELIRVFVPARAPREPVRVIAKLVREVSGARVEDAVVVRDISTSGAQLMIAAQAGLMAQDLTRMTLRLRPAGQKDYEIEARLARVVRVDQHYIVVGVHFVQVPPDLADVIHGITHVHSRRASELARVRMSKVPTTTRDAVDEPRESRPALGPRLK